MINFTHATQGFFIRQLWAITISYTILIQNQEIWKLLVGFH